MVLTVSFVLSPVIGFLVTVISRFFSQDLTPASRRQDHTTSPSASQRPRQKRRPRPPHPVPTSVTIAKRPSVWDGMARLLNLIWGKPEAEYFLNRGWTAQSVICPSGKSPCVPTVLQPDDSPRRDRGHQQRDQHVVAGQRQAEKAPLHFVAADHLHGVEALQQIAGAAEISDRPGAFGRPL